MSSTMSNAKREPGLATVALVYAIATIVQGRDPALVVVLGGVVVGAMAGAAISLLKILADPYDQLAAITFWLLGGLASARDVWGTMPAVVGGLVPLVVLRWRINVLPLGDEEARSLGVEAGRIRAVLIAAATVMTASLVSIAGVIGWVGLVIPHIAHSGRTEPRAPASFCNAVPRDRYLRWSDR